MNSSELKIFPLNNADVITASVPVGNPVGFFLGGFYDDTPDSENYYVAKDNDKLEQFATGSTYEEAFFDDGPIADAFEKLGLSVENNDYENLQNAHFSISGTELYYFPSGSSRSPLTLIDASKEMSNGNKSGIAFLGSTGINFVTLSEIFNQHLWQFDSTSFVFSTTEDKYTFDETDGTYTKNS